MATTGLYKLDDGEIYASNCFPVRSLFRQGVDGAGHWMMTPKTTQQKVFQAVVCSECTESWLKNNEPPKPQKPSAPPIVREKKPEGIVLDALFLLKTHYIDSPSDLCSVDVSDKNLTLAKEEDFGQFECVAYINAAENMLTLAHFRTFPAVRELELAMNGIRNLEVSAGEFPQLEVLDLSYNNLSPDDVLALGILPGLRVLHLTGNGLPHLPSDMAVTDLKKPAVERFPSLEVLMLDDNKLSHPNLFASLANLKRLKQLHLDNNGIYEIPYLHQMSDTPHVSSPTWVRVTTEREESFHSSSSFPSVIASKQRKCMPEETHTGGAKIHYVVSACQEDLDHTDVVFTSLPKAPEGISLPNTKNADKCFAFPDDFKTVGDNSLRRPIPAFGPPLPELRYLSLANNKIAREDDLLAVALFPSLAELVFYGNPLTTLRSGDPPLLTNFLHNRLGVQLIRRKITEARKPHIFIPVKENRKVKTVIPKIQKQPLMLGAPAESYLWHLDFHPSWKDHIDSGKQSLSPQMSLDPLPPIKIPTAEQSVLHGYVEQEISAPIKDTQQNLKTEQSTWNENVDSVFMTQVDDLPDSACKPQEEHRSKENPNLEKETCGTIPEIYRSYEELYHGEPDPDFFEPIGITQNVKALEHALKYLLVYPETKPKLQSIPKRYHVREKKALRGRELVNAVESGQEGVQFGKVAAIPSRKNKAEVLENILSSMKKAKTYTELPLALCLRNKKSGRKEYGEALMLLKEIQFQYHRFHEESAERAKELETANGGITADAKDARGQLSGRSGQC